MDKVIHTPEGSLEVEGPWYLRVGEQRKVLSRAASGALVNAGQIVEITEACLTVNETNHQKKVAGVMERLIILVKVGDERLVKHIFEDSLGPI